MQYIQVSIKFYHQFVYSVTLYLPMKCPKIIRLSPEKLFEVMLFDILWHSDIKRAQFLIGEGI